MLAGLPVWPQAFWDPQAAKASEKADRDYERAVKAIDERKYEEAVKLLNEYTARKGDRTDGALYWRAYSEAKLAEVDKALATLKQLQAYPNSRWLNDARALEMELRQKVGQTVSPESAGPDEDLKLMALNSLMQTDPEKALPVLEKVLNGTGSPRLKERALFVLSQSSSDQARQVVANIAKGNANPDLQRKAIRNLAISGSAANRKVMVEVYQSSTSVEVKREVLRGYMISGDKATLAQLAKSEKTPELRTEAIRQLGIMGDMATLREMYASETDAGVKQTIIQSLFVGGGADMLTEIAKTEKDPKLQQAAIRQMGLMGGKTADALAGFYASPDEGVKKAVIQALFVQGNAKKLIELARQETNPAMKKQIVQQLSVMGSKDATEFMMEILNK
jgi:tetratricopeptide (TPR) repeat protein